ncbi:porin family protein [Ohtaekwangia sp.]|uniref:porin family protein n=1 Tax=Ohtaekwangia sp. TaxID=2066019 RepID=UPI002F91E110
MKTNLKHILLVAGIMIITSTVTTFAQQRRAGIKGGLNVSNMYVDDVDDENARYGFNAGLFGEIISTEAFGLQAELLYSTKGSKFTTSGIIDQETKFNLNYLDLPVLAVFKLGKAVDLHLGAYGSYLLGANITTSGDLGSGTDKLDKDNFKSFDYGLVGGIGFNFGPTQVGARYNYGLAKIADSNTARDIIGNSKNSFAQLYIAFNLNHQPE